MRLERLDIRDLRSLESVRLRPAPALNLLLGDNGAGKTSVLEAMHLLAYGRSFRGRVRDGLVRTGAAAVEVFAEWSEDGSPGTRKAGLRHAGQAWEGRLDGVKVGHLGELCAALMVVSIEPGSHALVAGGGEPRRRFADWGLFHVEPEFLVVWRRYARTLKQRNALLKARAGGGQLATWDRELAQAGEDLHWRRAAYLARLEGEIATVAPALVPTLGRPTLDYQAGWRLSDMSLADALLNAQDRDRSFGYTSVGPHRADWRLRFEELPNAEPLSRGQAKLAAISCLLAQARDCAARRGEWPVVSIDDLAAELDTGHQERVLATLLETGAQLFITGTEAPRAVVGRPARVFHVEHGRITER